MPLNQEKQGLGGSVLDLITVAYSFLELESLSFIQLQTFQPYYPMTLIKLY